MHNPDGIRRKLEAVDIEKDLGVHIDTQTSNLQPTPEQDKYCNIED